MLKDCPFCNYDVSIEHENKTAMAILDKYPVTKFHTLIIPKRHVQSFFDLNEYEYLDCVNLIKKLKQDLCKIDAEITGFNIGINAGHDAGQTVDHCHIHLIPRRKNDVENPRGGIRHVIPDKGNYESIIAPRI